MKKVTTRIGDFIKIYKGKKAVLVSDSQKDDYQRFIQIDDLRNNNKLKFTNSKGVSVNPNDIIIAWDGANAGTIGHGLSGIIGSTLAKIEIQKNNIIPQYLGWFLKGKFRYLRDRCTGATIPHISREVLTNILIPLPSIEDQKRIVKILDAADALRQKRKQAITLLDDYLKSVFLDMFGDPIKNPKGWKSKEISELCRVKIGPFGSLLHKSDYIPDGIPLVNPKHMINGKIIVDPENCISKEKHNQLKDYHLKTGDLIMARRGEIGRCAVVTPQEDKFLCGTGSIFLRPEGEVNNVFLHYLFTTESMVRVFENGANGVTMQNLNANTVKKTNIIYPPINIQNKFSDIFTKTSELKKVMITQSAELEIGFQALMQKAFKGEL